MGRPRKPKPLKNPHVVLEVDCDCDGGWRKDPLAYTEQQKRQGREVRCTRCRGTGRVRRSVPLTLFVSAVCGDVAAIVAKLSEVSGG